MRSRFGVSFVFAPRKPIRSARVESSVIRMMLGLVAACVEIETIHRNKMTTTEDSAGWQIAPEHLVSLPQRAWCTTDRGPARPPVLDINCYGGENQVYFAFRQIQQIGLSLLLCAGAVLLLSCQPRKWHGERKLIILGIDGMDPQLLKKFMAEGKMPNFSSLSGRGLSVCLRLVSRRKAPWPGPT